MCATFEFVVGRVIIIEESQPVKNCKFSRLIANPRQNWSSERNSVYCFSTVFTLLQGRHRGDDAYQHLVLLEVATQSAKELSLLRKSVT